MPDIAFHDPSSDVDTTLHVVMGDTITVGHGGCVQPATVTVEVDAWFCAECRSEGRVSGEWVAACAFAVAGGEDPPVYPWTKLQRARSL